MCQKMFHKKRHVDKPVLMHNVLSSTYVVEVGQILFFINQTLQMILMVLVMVVD